MSNKIYSKDWDLSVISKKHSFYDLLEQWKKACLAEALLRKDAFKSLQDFKKWWFAFLKADSLETKQRIVYNEYSKLPNPTDEQKDLVAEVNRVLDELAVYYKKLPKIYNMLNKNRKTLLSYLKKDKDLSKYTTKIKIDFLDKEGHVISDEDKKAAEATWGLEVLKNIYQSLNDDAFSEPILDKDGRIVKSFKSWDEASTSCDEFIRKQTFIAYFTLERRHRNTFFTIAKYLAARQNQNAKYYKYSSWMEQDVETRYNISIKDYFSIVNNFPKFSKAHNEYITYADNLVAKAFGLKKLNIWDSNLKIKNTDDSITQAQAKELIFNSLSCLGKEYLDKVQQCFDKNIIKWHKGSKYDGYCISGTSLLDEHPISFEWNGTTKSAGILAHEIGHNVYGSFVKENNEINTDSTELFVEIPSIVNSILFYLNAIKHMKEIKAPKEHIYHIYRCLISYLSDNISFTAYGIKLSEVGTKRLLSQKMTPIKFEQLGLNILSDALGFSKAKYKEKTKWPTVIMTLKAYTTFIENLLSDNININYFIGSVVALAIVPKLMAGDETTLNKYLKLLKTGTSLNPIKTLNEVLGINLLRPQVYTQANHTLEQIIKDFKKDIKI